MLAPRPTPKLEDHPSSAVRRCLFNLFTATLHIGGRSSIRNLRTRHAVVTGTHIHGGIIFIIKQKMNVTMSLLDDIKTKQLQWYGHVQRMEEERLPKEVMKWRPPGRRKQGRPKLTWVEGIRGLMGEKRLTL